jgi:hypothetical protein
VLLLIILIFSIVFGLATQIGALEMSTYRGRSGWYLMMMALLGMSYIFDEIPFNKRYLNLMYVLLLVIFLAGFISPPTYYREYYTEPFTQAKLISRQFPNQKINFITDEKRVPMVSNNISFSELDSSSLKDTCEFDKCFLILNNKFFYYDPVLSEKALSTDKGFREFNKEQALLKDAQNETISEIKKSPNFSKYQKYWEDENVTIYQFAN